MTTKHKNCLILNVDYSPIGIVAWQRAMIWFMKIQEEPQYSSIDILDFHNNEYICGTNNKKFPLPAVIKTKFYLKLHKNQYVNFSRKNLFIRDNYTCQYCGQTMAPNQLTYDHIIPKSKWNHNYPATCWTNITTACYSCNRKKGNKTPQQANMKILSSPHRPTIQPKYLPIVSHLSRIDTEIPEIWRRYIGNHI
jgi:hypothetical protein